MENKNLLIIGGLVLVIVLIYVFMLKDESGSDDENDETTTTTPPPITPTIGYTYPPNYNTPDPDVESSISDAVGSELTTS